MAAVASAVRETVSFAKGSWSTQAKLTLSIELVALLEWSHSLVGFFF